MTLSSHHHYSNKPGPILVSFHNSCLHVKEEDDGIKGAFDIGLSPVKGRTSAHRQQGPRAPARRSFVGLGAGADRLVAAVRQAQGGRRDVAGRHDLTKAEINGLYFTTHKMERPRGWDGPYRAVLARRIRPALQLWLEYRDRLEIRFHDPIL